jgi:excisionase family DNA binding protein
MRTHHDDIVAPGVIFEPDAGDLDALLHRVANPPDHVIESPLELLADRLLLKVDEVAEIMRIDLSTAYKMIRAGQIESIRVGANERGIRVPAQPLARRLGAECPHCGEIGGAR